MLRSEADSKGIKLRIETFENKIIHVEVFTSLTHISNAFLNKILKWLLIIEVKSKSYKSYAINLH